MRNVILKGLAIASALAFLAVVMVNACARYAAPTKAAPVVHPAPAPAAAPAAAPPPPDHDYDKMRGAPTKAAPVFEPRPLVRPPKQSAEPQRQAP